MLQQVVNQRLYNKKRGFKVVDTIEDGGDEYGPKYWITCRNGWEGRDHELNNKIWKSIREELVNIVNNGISVNDKIHYIYPKIIFSDKYMKEISKEEYDINMKNKKFLLDIKEKLKQGLSKCSVQIWKSTGVSISQKNKHQS